MSKIQLFCLPCAGGSAIMYNKWQEYLKDDIILHPIELAGRGGRFGAKLYRCFEEAVDDIFDSITPYLDTEYAFFGHSMGGWLSYELAHKIMKEGFREPEHLFIAARDAPHIENIKASLSQLPVEEFKKEIIKLGGTPKEVYQNKELFDLFIPVLMSDYRIVETYKHIPKKNKLNCDLTVLYGLSDNLKLDDLLKWSEVTNRKIEMIGFDGGHFFLKDNVFKIVELINKNLPTTNK